MKMTTDHSSNTDPLEGLFQTARATPEPSSDFMARVLADALAVQSAAAVVGVKRPVRSAWKRALAAVGGGFGLAGIGAAAVAGLLIGYVQPDPVLTLGEDIGLSADYASLDLSFGFDALLSEDGTQ